jgi:hypothetical protein
MIILSVPFIYHVFSGLIILAVFVAALPFLTTNKIEQAPTATVTIGYYFNDINRRIAEAETPEALFLLRIEIEAFYSRKYINDPAPCMRRALRKSLLITHNRKEKELK